MQITVQQQGQVTIVSIVGSIDTITAEEVSKYLSNQIKQGSVKLVADLSHVEYVSSAGLRVLLGTAKEARRSSGDLRIAALVNEVLDILKMAGFTRILEHYSTIEEAVASFNGGE